MYLSMSCCPCEALQPSSLRVRLSWRPQMPPWRLVWFITASIPNSTSPRNAAPTPLFTTVAASLTWLPLTPVSVAPPLWPAEHAWGPLAWATAAPAAAPPVVPVVPPVAPVPVVLAAAAPLVVPVVAPWSGPVAALAWAGPAWVVPFGLTLTSSGLPSVTVEIPAMRTTSAAAVQAAHAVPTAGRPERPGPCGCVTSLTPLPSRSCSPMTSAGWPGTPASPTAPTPPPAGPPSWDLTPAGAIPLGRHPRCDVLRRPAGLCCCSAGTLHPPSRRCRSSCCRRLRSFRPRAPRRPWRRRRSYRHPQPADRCRSATRCAGLLVAELHASSLHCHPRQSRSGGHPQCHSRRRSRSGHSYA